MSEVTTTPTLSSIDLKLIKESETNPRKHFNEDALNDLARSITEKGVLEPILLRPKGKGYELVAGARRYRASKIAKLKEIPAIVRELSDKEALEIQVTENLQRADLSPMEEARGYKLLIDEHGYTAEELAHKVGKSLSYLHKRLQLNNLAPEIQKFLESGQITYSHAIHFARVADEDLQRRAFNDTVSSYHVRSPNQIKQYIEDRVLVTLSKAPFSLSDADLLPVVGACTTCPNNTGTAEELFDDMRKADRCTNPPCFRKKTDKYWSNAKKEARTNGQVILEGRDAQIFNHNNLVEADSGYVEARAKCEDHPKKLTYGKIVGKMLQPILVRDAKKKIRYVFKLSDFKETVKNEKWAKKVKLPKQKPSRIDQWHIDQRIDNRFKHKRISKILEVLPQSSIPDGLVLRALTLAISPDSILVSKGVLKPNMNYDDRKKGVLSFSKTATEQELREVIVTYLAVRENDLYKEFQQYLEIDNKQLKKEARAEILAEIKAEEEGNSANEEVADIDNEFDD